MDHTNDMGPCAHSCGREAEKYSSGTPECWQCWNRRKLDLPAASHWARVAAEFLSNVDVHDTMSYFGSCGLDDSEARTMLESAERVRDYSQRMLDAGYGEV